jgi:branched-chain amino acid transport system ATP-binding protein
MTEILKVVDLHSYYGKSHILFGLDLEVHMGETVALLGRNGMGKTTTLKSIMGIVPPHQGRIIFMGKEITDLQSHEISRLGIGYVPEDRRIFPELTVLENLMTGLQRVDISETRKRELLDHVYSCFPVLHERSQQLGGTLSGGEQQMLAIARAMVIDPALILMDEPTEGLMPILVKEIENIVDILHQQGVAVLLVEQNVKMSLGVSSRGYILERGEVHHHGPSEEIASNEEILKTYLSI